MAASGPRLVANGFDEKRTAYADIVRAVSKHWSAAARRSILSLSFGYNDSSGTFRATKLHPTNTCFYDTFANALLWRHVRPLSILSHFCYPKLLSISAAVDDLASAALVFGPSANRDHSIDCLPGVEEVESACESLGR